MKIVFFGSDPWFSPPVLAAILKAKHQVALIVTKGNAFKNFRFKNSDFRFIQAETAEDILRFTNNNRPDVIILAAFGPPFLPSEVLNWPKYGCLNVHASLLPRWRGASPVFASLREGDRETGVTIMKMTEEIDRGPVLEQAKIKILHPVQKSQLRSAKIGLHRITDRSEKSESGLSDLSIIRSGPPQAGQADPAETPTFPDYDTRETLTKKLGILGGKLIVETLKKLENDQISEISQPQKSPTPYTRRLTKDSGRIDWRFRPGETDLERNRRIERFIRAVTPWPGAETNFRFKISDLRFKMGKVKILKAHLEVQQLTIDLIQLPGKNPISWKAFLTGHPKTVLF